MNIMETDVRGVLEPGKQSATERVHGREVLSSHSFRTDSMNPMLGQYASSTREIHLAINQRYYISLGRRPRLVGLTEGRLIPVLVLCLTPNSVESRWRWEAHSFANVELRCFFPVLLGGEACQRWEGFLLHGFVVGCQCIRSCVQWFGGVTWRFYIDQWRGRPVR